MSRSYQRTDMSKDENALILKAEFNPDVRKYWLLSGVWILFSTIVGIPFLILWWVLGLYFTQRYLDRMECILLERSLVVRKGMFVRIEKTVPLDKITDLGMVQGPIMRFFNIEKLTVETAGQSSQGALISLTGIRDALSFRDKVLEQKETISRAFKQPGAETTSEPVGSTHEVLLAIRDSLGRIEKLLDKDR